MPKIDRNSIHSLIFKLMDSVHKEEIDAAAMYEIHAYLVHVNSPVAVRATTLLDAYDSAAYDNDVGRTGPIAKRMVGLLEGVSLSLDDKEERSTLKITFEPEPGTPVFALTRDERQKVLQLASEMRACVVSSDFFDHAHKVRLIKRISAIEAEVHKPRGLFDVILGGLNDAGEALGKFGNDVKPIVDRMKEIAKITRGKSEEYESLPAPEETKRLPPPGSSDE
jgi:hypothetical protein